MATPIPSVTQLTFSVFSSGAGSLGVCDLGDEGLRFTADGASLLVLRNLMGPALKMFPRPIPFTFLPWISTTSPSGVLSSSPETSPAHMESMSETPFPLCLSEVQFFNHSLSVNSMVIRVGFEQSTVHY